LQSLALFCAPSWGGKSHLSSEDYLLQNNQLFGDARALKDLKESENFDWLEQAYFGLNEGK
jgi:hypothetical protein